MAMMDINDVRPEMVIESDLCDANDNILLKAGSVLSDVWIQRLKKRGVSSIDVSPVFASDSDEKSGDTESSSSSSDLPFKDLQAHMKLIFTPTLTQPHMKALARSTYQFLKNKTS